MSSMVRPFTQIVSSSGVSCCYSGLFGTGGGGLLDGTETKYGKTLLLDSRVTL